MSHRRPPGPPSENSLPTSRPPEGLARDSPVENTSVDRERFRLVEGGGQGGSTLLELVAPGWVTAGPEQSPELRQAVEKVRQARVVMESAEQDLAVALRAAEKSRERDGASQRAPAAWNQIFAVWDWAGLPDGPGPSVDELPAELVEWLRGVGPADIFVPDLVASDDPVTRRILQVAHCSLLEVHSHNLLEQLNELIQGLETPAQLLLGGLLASWAPEDLHAEKKYGLAFQVGNTLGEVVQAKPGGKWGTLVHQPPGSQFDLVFFCKRSRPRLGKLGLPRLGVVFDREVPEIASDSSMSVIRLSTGELHEHPVACADRCWRVLESPART